MQISEFIRHLNFSRSFKAFINHNTDVVSVCLLEDNTDKLKENVIYLTTDLKKAAALAADERPKNLLCLCSDDQIKEAQEIVVSASVNLVLSDPDDMTDLFLMRSKLTDQVFSDLNEQVKLLEDLIISEGMEELIARGKAYLGHSFLIFDSGQNLLCSGDMDEQTQEDARNLIADLQPFSEQEGVEQFNSPERATYIAERMINGSAGTLLLSQFTADQRVYGYLAVDCGDGLVAQMDYHRTAVMSSLVCKLILSMDRVRNPVNTFETLFIRLLEENISLQNVREECRKLNWSVPSKTRILVVRTDAGRDYSGVLEPILDEIKAIIPGSAGLIYMNRIVMFVDDKNIDNTALESCFEKWQVSGGFSQTFEDLPSARKYYHQADSARKLARELSLPGRLHFYETMNYYFLLQDVRDPSKLKSLIHPGIFALYESDRENHTELLKTFESYVECIGNINLVSEKMFVHRNTIKYRISKIEEILQEDLKDPDRYQLFLFSFKIIDYLQRTNQW